MKLGILKALFLFAIPSWVWCALFALGVICVVVHFCFFAFSKKMQNIYILLKIYTYLQLKKCIFLKKV